MTEVSDASVENIESSENWYFWKKKIHIAEKKNILQWTDIWQISDTYLCDQGDGWWQGLTAEPLHKYWTNICGILGKYLVNFGKYLSNIGSIFGKYLWDQRVRADDRDWLLWAELLFGSDNRTGLPLLKHIVVLFIIIIIIIIIIVVVVIIIFIIFTTIKSWFWLPPNMPFLSGALLFAALVVHRNEVCTKRNLYKDCVTTKKHHSC